MKDAHTVHEPIFNKQAIVLDTSEKCGQQKSINIVKKESNDKAEFCLAKDRCHNTINKQPHGDYRRSLLHAQLEFNYINTYLAMTSTITIKWLYHLRHIKGRARKKKGFSPVIKESVTSLVIYNHHFIRFCIGISCLVGVSRKPLYYRATS